MNAATYRKLGQAKRALETSHDALAKAVAAATDPRLKSDLRDIQRQTETALIDARDLYELHT